MFTFRPLYFALALVLFGLEVYIGLYVKDDWIRPYGGDYLVVILLYCLVRSLTTVSVTRAAVGVLLFAYLIEGLQVVRIVDRLGLADYPLAAIVIGTDFAWLDMLAYTLGIASVAVVEFARVRYFSTA